MDAFLLVSTVVVGILLVIANIYLFALFIHPDDRGFGDRKFPIVMVVKIQNFL